MKTACSSATIRKVLGALLLVVPVLLISIVAPWKVEAVEPANVRTSFVSTIEVNPDNKARFIIDITFSNVGDNPTILTSYDLVIGDVHPSEVQAKSGVTVLGSNVIENNGTTIQVALGNAVLRPENTFSIEVSYAVDYFMAVRGGTHDAELPLFQQSEIAQGESVTFSYPEAFGDVNYSTAPFSKQTENGYTVVSFNDLASISRLYLSVGNERYVSVSFERALTNTAEGYAKQEVLIPPEFSSQYFVVHSITPAPDSARYSSDGNYILTYSVPGKDTLWVRVQGVLISKLQVESEYYLDPEETETYLDTEEDWWHITDESLLDDVEAMSEIDTLDEKIDRLYQYTMDELILSEGFRELHGTEYRKGAQVALKTYKNASVEDYADVFVSLSRYAGIPARVVAGYVYPYSLDEGQLGMFHVWPQYWSADYGWVSVDPAYEMYAGLQCRDYVGLNRVVTAISYDPALYGSFQETSSEYTVTDQSAQPNPLLHVEVQIPSDIPAGSSTPGLLKIRNEGNSVLRNLSYLEDSIDDIGIVIGEAMHREVIVPGQVAQVTFTIDPFEWYVNGERSVRFTTTADSIVGTQMVEESAEFSIKPLWWVEPVTWLITVMAFVLFLWTVWSGAKVGKWFLGLFRRKETNLGGKIIS